MAPLRKGAFLFAYVKNFFILGNVTHAFAVCLRKVKKKNEDSLKDFSERTVYYSVRVRKTARPEKKVRKTEDFLKEFSRKSV